MQSPKPGEEQSHLQEHAASHSAGKQLGRKGQGPGVSVDRLNISQQSAFATGKG